MCGRYSFAPKLKQLEKSAPELELPAQLDISFNIAPTHLAYVIANDHPKALQKMEWGIVPHWSADGKNSGKLINARAEGIAEKPSFRDAIRTRRCLVPADSFYEWRNESGGKKAPYRIFMDNGEMLFMAGIWEQWQEEGRTFSVITTTPNKDMETLHNRMPVILPDYASRQLWLSDLPLQGTLAMLKPVQDGTLIMHRISDKLNKPGYDQPDLHQPVAEPWTLF